MNSTAGETRRMVRKMDNWRKEQEFEKSWWGDCSNTYGEEEKQIVYAKYMGLQFFHNTKSPYNINLEGNSILDIGGGPSSLLLKCINGNRIVLDPCEYPDWVKQRYAFSGIKYICDNAENQKDISVDEVWCYNVLQHSYDPELIIRNMKSYGKIIRLFEWIDTIKTPGHPHILTEDVLNGWLGGFGQVTTLNLPTLRGKAYFGIFKGDRYKY